MWQQITPVFCDIDPRTHNIDPARIEELITGQTTGIIGVHVWGRPCAIDALSELALRRKLKLVFDSAHAFGCSYQGRMIGNFGDVEVFSFHATKFFNTFEGGAIATNNDELATKVRLMRNFGFAGYDKVIHLGTNGKMSEVSAAMGLTGLEDLEKFTTINYENYKRYKTHLEKLPGVGFVSYDETEKCNYQYIILEIDEETAGLGRDDLIKILHKENVLARRYFHPGCHQMEPYRSYFPDAGISLKATERLTQRTLSLPTGTGVTIEDIDRICEIVRFTLGNASNIRKRLVEPQGIGAGAQN